MKPKFDYLLQRLFLKVRYFC